MFSTIRSAFVLGALLVLAAGSARAADPSTADLIAAAKSGDESARLQAIDELGSLGEKAAEAVAPLTELLADESAAVRAHAARALGKIGSPAKAAAAALTGLVKDEDEAVRRQAVKALTAIRPGPQVMIPLMVKLMEDADPALRTRILQSIAEAGPAVVPGLIAALKNDKAAYWACLALREIGPPAKAAVPALILALKDPRPEIRREAILALGAMNEAAISAWPQIAAALDDESVQVAATFALGQIGKTLPEGLNAEKRIQENAKSEDKFLSTVSSWTLARVHPQDKKLHREAAERLVARLMDENPFVRVAAARALAALPPAPEIMLPIWEKVLKDSDETTVQHALDALASLGPASVPRLLDGLKHKHLRPQVIYVLGQIGPGAAPATDALAKLVGDEDSQVATESALALAKIGPGAKAAVPALSAAWEQKDCPNAHAIVYALGKIGPGAAAAEAKLLESLTCEDHSLAAMSAWALTQVHPKSKEIVAKALPVVIAGLADPLPESRQAAAEALGNLGPLATGAIGALEKATKDEDQSVREAAAEALRLIRGTAAKTK